jgi:hypothetical protein
MTVETNNSCLKFAFYLHLFIKNNLKISITRARYIEINLELEIV